MIWPTSLRSPKAPTAVACRTSTPCRNLCHSLHRLPTPCRPTHSSHRPCLRLWCLSRQKLPLVPASKTGTSMRRTSESISKLSTHSTALCCNTSKLATSRLWRGCRRAWLGWKRREIRSPVVASALTHVRSERTNASARFGTWAVRDRETLSRSLTRSGSASGTWLLRVSSRSSNGRFKGTGAVRLDFLFLLFLFLLYPELDEVCALSLAMHCACARSVGENVSFAILL